MLEAKNKNIPLSISKYNFIFRAEEELFLPPYKGSTLRGGFGITFRRICCVNKNIGLCDECGLKEKCAYAYVFETSPSQDVTKLKNLTEIPRPFVIEPPLETRTIYKKGEYLEFGLILFGKAIDYLPYFIITFKELGNVGIGKARGRFKLQEVDNFYKEKIYDAEDEMIKNIDSKVDLAKIMKAPHHYLSLKFFTPTRIKLDGDLVVKPEFHVIIRALLHRISALAYFHCGKELELDYKRLISEAGQIKIKESEINWVDWERYSSRQNTRMKLGGFIGEITYEGNFEPFLPLLLLGQHTHIGKNCTFGLGKYEIKNGVKDE